MIIEGEQSKGSDQPHQFAEWNERPVFRSAYMITPVVNGGSGKKPMYGNKR
jgi:hypothetical protein